MFRNTEKQGGVLIRISIDSITITRPSETPFWFQILEHIFFQSERYMMQTLALENTVWPECPKEISAQQLPYRYYRFYGRCCHPHLQKKTIREISLELCQRGAKQGFFI